MLEEAKRAQFGDQPIGQGNILVWKVLMHVIWKLADGTVAMNLKEYSGFGWILMIQL